MNSIPAFRNTRPGGYPRLFAAGLINGIGDRFSQVAMLSLILQMTGSAMAVGLALGLKLLPSLIMAPLGGYAGGRLSRKTVMIVTDLARVPVALSFLLVNGPERMWILYIASFLLASGEAFYAPVRKSSIPLLTEESRLIRVNGMEQLMTGCVLILGALTGGAVSHWFGPQMAFAMNALSFAAAAAVIAGISFPGERRACALTDEPAESAADTATPCGASDGMAIKLVAEEAAGGAATSGRPKRLSRDNQERSSARGDRLSSVVAGSVVLQIVLGYEMLVSIIGGMDNVLISVYAMQVFRAGEVGVGLLYASLGAGLSLSFWLLRLLRRHLLAGALSGLLLEGLLHIVLSRMGTLGAACAVYVLLALVSGAASACLDTLLMRETPQRHQPVMLGLMTAAGSTLLGLSMLLAGGLLETVSPRTLGVIGGVCFTGAALLLAGYAGARRVRGEISVFGRNL